MPRVPAAFTQVCRVASFSASVWHDLALLYTVSISVFRKRSRAPECYEKRCDFGCNSRLANALRWEGTSCNRRSACDPFAPSSGAVMLKSTVFSLTLGVAATLASAAFAADSLFSEVPINSVFGKPGAAPPAPPAVTPGAPAEQRPSDGRGGVETIMAAVKEAGFEPKQLSAQVISTKVQLDKWSFPVLVTTAEDKQEVVLVMLLSVVKDQQQLPSAKLLELLSASREHAPAYFAYSSKRQRIELYRTLENRTPSAELLKTEINRLATIAKATEGLWNLGNAAAAPPATTSPAKTTPAAPAAGTTSLVGKWSASRSAKEAFALQLSANGKYVLVHVHQGQQTKSTGQFTFTGQALTLVGDDGTKLTGQVAGQTAKQFQFSPAGGKSAALTFRKAS